MDYQLTVVVRFTTKEDLETQLDNLGLSESDEIELLCIGCKKHSAFDDVHSILKKYPNARLEFIDGDYALARTQASYLANSEYLLFPTLAYAYDWSNILDAVTEAASSNIDLLILRSNNRNRIPNRKRSPKSARLDIDSNSKNFFQAIGCTFAYTVVAKTMLQKTNEFPYCETARDNAYILSLACNSNAIFITGAKTNGVKKNNRSDDDPKQDFLYAENSIIDSLSLILEYRDFAVSKGDDDLIDSFMRVYASRIRTYLIQNNDFTTRKPILDLISQDEQTLSFFVKGRIPDWPKATLKCFEFTKWAIKTYIKKTKSESYNYATTELVVASSIENPRVSMIVPVYNSAAYIETTLRSALAQTYRDFEIICINDGSTDNSLNVLKEISEQDGRIAIYNQPNMGQSIARNAAIEVARGEFVYFFDSDDLLEPNLLELSISKIDSMDLDMILFDAKTFYESDQLASDHDSFSSYYSRSRSYDLAVPGTELMFEMKSNQEYRVSPCMYVAKLSIIKENGIRFIPGIIHEDNAFTFELMNCSSRASHIDEPLYLRRVHEESVMTSNKTFDNAYGYFVCARKMLSHDFSVADKHRNLAYSLAIPLSYSMLKLAQRDLHDAPDGQEGGAYALNDLDFRMFLLLVLDAERLARKLDKATDRTEELKEKISEADAEIAKLQQNAKAPIIEDQKGGTSFRENILGMFKKSKKHNKGGEQHD